MDKSKILFLIALILGIIGLVGYGYFRATPQVKKTENLPEIEITPELFDFGEVEYGQVLNYTFQVKNKGKAILKIKRVATSCACTTAKVEKEILNSGEETELSVRYDTGAMSGPHGRGKQERIIYVQSNDSENPQKEVTIYAIVR